MLPKKLIELDDAHGRAMVTEQFLARLHRSTELLRSDRSDEARKILDDAFESQSMDPTGQATLALVYFKLGLYPRALLLYQKLAIEYPDDPVLHLNLALVLFKTGHTEEARDTLESVVEIAPDYRKAHGYLGLACQRLGEYERAMEAFKLAGAEHMAERMAKFVEPASMDITEPDSDPAHIVDADLPSIPPSREREPEPEPRDSHIPPFLTTSPFPLSTSDRGPSEPVPVHELADQTKLGEPLEGRFLIAKSGYLLTNVADRVNARLSGLHFCSSEGLAYSEIKKRCRNSREQEPFDGDDGALYEIKGGGRLGFHPGNGVFSAVSLENEIAHIREDMLFAFDPELSYENGKMPEETVSLVHLKGVGALVIKSPVVPHSLEVTPERGVIIPVGGLVGWFGRLLPRNAAGGPFSPDLETVEFVGEGVLLFCLP